MENELEDYANGVVYLGDEIWKNPVGKTLFIGVGIVGGILVLGIA